MKIAFFNQHLDTMGGGEQYMGAMAVRLAEKHQVDLILHKEVDLELFKARLGLDLTGLRVRLVPYAEDYQFVQQVSAEYDVFINSSFKVMFPAYARQNIYVVFFPEPDPHELEPADYQATPLVRLWQGLLANTALFQGFYPPDFDAKGHSYRWSGPNAEILLSGLKAGRSYPLKVVVSGYRPESIATPATLRFFLNNQPFGLTHELPREGFVELNEKIPGELVTGSKMVLRLETLAFSPKGYDPKDARELGLTFNDIKLVDNRGKNWLRQRTGLSGVGLMPEKQSPADFFNYSLETYQSIFAISEYSQHWIKKCWKRDSRLLYPPVQVQRLRSLEKKPQIFSVGRFFAGFHNKKHLEMIKAFRQMVDEGLIGWEYHLAGGYSEVRKIDREYMEQVRKVAEGYPIFIHPNLSLEELARFYGESQIFWHATGLDENENATPESFEHFGITTVEAMAAGCVPVVINKAGQVEIVSQEETGLLWNTLDECRKFTSRLINDDALRQCLSLNAQKRSLDFGPDRFNATLDDLMGG